MKKLLSFLVCGLFFASPAFAGGECYSSAELRAEQLLRLHSELMVITVTCRQGSQGENLVPAYTGFTHTNINVLHDAEQTMMNYYSNTHGGDGIEQLDSLRTRLGNESGQEIADMSAPVYCSKYRDKVLSFYQGDSTQIVSEVQRMVVAEKSYGHLCPSSGTRIAKGGQ